MMIVQQTKPAFYPITTEDVSATDMPECHQLNNRIHSVENKLKKQNHSSEIVSSVQRKPQKTSVERNLQSVQEKKVSVFSEQDVLPSQRKAEMLSAEQIQCTEQKQTDVCSVTQDEPTLFSYTIADSFSKLCDIQETALSMAPKPDFTAALKSEELKGKLFGLYTDKKDKEKGFENLPQLLVEFIEVDKTEYRTSFGNATADNNHSTEENSLPFTVEYV